MSSSPKNNPRRPSSGGSAGPPAPPPDLAELQRERDRLSDILRQTTDMVGSADPQGRTLFINRAGRLLLGIDPDEELGGRPIASYSPPWAWEVIRDQGLPTAIREGAWTGETAMIGAGGEEIPVSQVIIAHRGADGELAYLSTIARDIRDRKRRETELDASRRALQERVKEQSCLYAVSEVLGRAELPLAERLREVVRRIPAGWQRPEITETLLVADGVRYRTEDFRETRMTLRQQIRAGGRVRGRLVVACTEPPPSALAGEGPFLPEEQRLLDALARMIGEAIERTSAFEALARSEEKFAAVFRMSPLAMYITTADEDRFLDVNPAFLRRFGYDRDEVIGTTTQDLGPWSGRKERRPAAGRRRRAPVPGQDEERTLRTRDGEEVEVSFFTERMEIDGRPCLLTVAQDVTERRRTEREMQFLAMYDPLTRLPNRRLFEDRLARSLARAEREGHEVAVLFVDLDGFKRVNDSLGHRGGDRLLEEVAERLVHCFRKVDTVARFGGDEFTALIESRSIDELLELLAGRLRAAFEEPFRILDTEVRVQASFGLVRSSALEGPLGSDDLLRYADVAMYQAKAAGGGLHVFDPDGDPGATSRPRR